VVLIFLGVLILTNMISDFALWVLSPLLRYSQNMPA
jgi:hypothetical protein